MSKPSAKEIAERIIADEDLEMFNDVDGTSAKILARAYLELERKHKITDLEVIENLEFELGKANLNKELVNDVSRLELVQCILFWKSFIDKVKDESNLEITKLKEENAQLSKYCGEVRYWQNRAEDLSEEKEKLKEELAAEKADKQRVLDIGVKMQRGVNDRVEAENMKMKETLTKIANEDYRGNRPYSAVIAYKALEELERLKP